MNPGRLNRHLRLEAIITAPDGAGGTTLSGWVQVAEFMGEVIPSDGSRYLETSQISFSQAFRITTYFMPDLFINRRQRIVIDSGENVIIHSIRNLDSRNQWVEIFGYTQEGMEEIQALEIDGKILIV
jgi:hypothetical protein